jgi:hypothetical protein
MEQLSSDQLKDFVDYTVKSCSVPIGELSYINQPPNHTLQFHKEGKAIGTFNFNGDKMDFTGDVTESAKVFIDFVARTFHGRLLEERKKQIEIDAGICESIDSLASSNPPVLCAKAIRSQEVK